MALAPFFMSSTSILLLSPLVIASATDYGYAPKPDYGQPKPQDYKPLPTEQPDYGKPKPQGNYGKPSLPTKPDDYDDQKPKPDQGNNKLPSLPTKPDYEKQDSKEKDELLAKVIGIQGLVLCRLASKYVPLKAVARITCKAVDEKGYEAIPFSILSDECDAKGYFLATLSSSFLKENWKIKECKAFLEHSPLETCKVPIDVNHGITGARLSSFSILSDKHDMKLFSVGRPFFCTSEPHESSLQLPQTGY